MRHYCHFQNICPGFFHFAETVQKDFLAVCFVKIMGRSNDFDTFPLKLCHQFFLFFWISHHFHIHKVCYVASGSVSATCAVIFHGDGNISAFLACADSKKKRSLSKDFRKLSKHLLTGFFVHQALEEVRTPLHQVCSGFFRILGFLADFFFCGSRKRNTDFGDSCPNGQILDLNRFCHFLTSPFY